MKITVYDGADTIGGNKIFVEYDEKEKKGVFLDFGMNFARNNRYFQQFLSVRVVRGIYDLLTLDLIPQLNIYREDLIPKDIQTKVKKFPKLNIEAVLVSHAHQDHYGYIGLLDNSIPIIASPKSLALMKGISDSGFSSLGTKVLIDKERYKVKAKKDRVLKSSSSIIKRPLVSTEEIVEQDFKDFLKVDEDTTLKS